MVCDFFVDIGLVIFLVISGSKGLYLYILLDELVSSRGVMVLVKCVV